VISGRLLNLSVGKMKRASTELHVFLDCRKFKGQELVKLARFLRALSFADGCTFLLLIHVDPQPGIFLVISDIEHAALLKH
jgi:hypothetical protein